MVPIMEAERTKDIASRPDKRVETRDKLKIWGCRPESYPMLHLSHIKTSERVDDLEDNC